MTQNYTVPSKSTGDQLSAVEVNQIRDMFTGIRKFNKVLIDHDIEFKPSADGQKIELCKDGQCLIEIGKWGTTVEHSVGTGVGSFDLGGIFTIGSGGERVLVVDKQTNEAYVVGGAKLSSGGTTATVEKELVFGDLQTLPPTFPVGGVVAPATWDNNPASNTAIFANVIKPAENYAGRLIYRTVIKSSGKEAVRFDLDVNLTANAEFTINYVYPVLAPAGVDVTVRIEKEDGTLLNVYGATDTMASRQTTLRSYEERPFFDDVFVTADRDISRGAKYMVDCSNGVITLTPSLAQGMNSFSVYDAGSTFSAVNPCIVAFGGAQGNATLQTPKDAFEFYHDGSNWRYIDLNTKGGGVV